MTISSLPLTQAFSREGVLESFRAFFPEQRHLTDPVQMRQVLAAHLAGASPWLRPHWDRTDFERALYARLHEELGRVVAH